ncbi:MAG TPA: potassium-transporting ATPase subunit KdpC [Dehalococcoidia bacterium]|nr:potassium-transporting ATPase subunit KdpC [Dehalococcoidia bacterium]
MLRTTLLDLRTAIVSFVLLSVLLGLAYPYAITGVAQAVFHRQANGSLVSVSGQDVGSSLVGENFSSPAYFHPRPSAAGKGYDGTSSSGSNLGPSSKALATAVAGYAQQVRQDNGLAADAKLPVDAVTASGSGLDPHISPDYAQLQVARVAHARGVSDDQVQKLVQQNTDGSTFAVLGEPRVNVLRLNVALDSAFGAPLPQQPTPTAAASSQAP